MQRYKELSNGQALLNAILLQAGKMQLSQRVASAFVGGRGRLSRLIADGKITQFEKPNQAQNGKVRYNGRQVLQNTIIKL